MHRARAALLTAVLLTTTACSDPTTVTMPPPTDGWSSTTQAMDGVEALELRAQWRLSSSSVVDETVVDLADGGCRWRSTRTSAGDGQTGTQWQGVGDAAVPGVWLQRKADNAFVTTGAEPHEKLVGLAGAWLVPDLCDLHTSLGMTLTADGTVDLTRWQDAYVESRVQAAVDTARAAGDSPGAAARRYRDPLVPSSRVPSNGAVLERAGEPLVELDERGRMTAFTVTTGDDGEFTLTVRYLTTAQHIDTTQLSHVDPEADR